MKAFTAIIFCFVFQVHANAAEVVIDDFESGILERLWEIEKASDDAITIVQNPQGIGNVVRFNWEKNAWDGTRKTKSAELKKGPFPGMPALDIRMRIFLEKNLAITSNKPVIIMQIHSVPDFALGETYRHPVSALLLRNGHIFYSYRSSRPMVTPMFKGKWKYDSEEEVDLGAPNWGQWNSFQLQQHFDFKEEPKGSIKIILNDKAISINDLAVGFNDKQGPYFKFGVYCPQSFEQDVAVYFDDVSVTTLD